MLNSYLMNTTCSWHMCHGSSLKYGPAISLASDIVWLWMLYNIHSLWCSQLFTTPTSSRKKGTGWASAQGTTLHFFSCLSFRCVRDSMSMLKTYNLSWATQHTPDMICLVSQKERSFLECPSKVLDRWRYLEVASKQIRMVYRAALAAYKNRLSSST